MLNSELGSEVGTTESLPSLNPEPKNVNPKPYTLNTEP